MRNENPRGQLPLPFGATAPTLSNNRENNVLCFARAKAAHEHTLAKEKEKSIIDNIVNLSRRLSW